MVLFNVASPRTACWAIRSQVRSISSSRKPQRIPRGALLYVPASSDKFLHSSLRSPAATLTFDLEDSVHASSKPAARARLASFLRELSSPARPPHGLSIAVRPNTLHLPPDEGGLGEDGAVRLASGEEELKEGYGVEDVRSVWGSEGAKRWNDGAGPMMVAPKIDHPSMLTALDHLIVSLRDKHPHPKTPVIASIESPEALMNISHIAGWRGRGMELVGLLFAAEDFCASSHILRTPQRTELLHVRSSIVVAARAFGLAAIDMVCIDYKDHAVLQAESVEGRQLGFDGKQAIHPSQVDSITQAFAPSEKEIRRASLILAKMSASADGAIGLPGPDGKKEMIDRPMVLQAQRIVKEAREAGLAVPDVSGQ